MQQSFVRHFPVHRSSRHSQTRHLGRSARFAFALPFDRRFVHSLRSAPSSLTSQTINRHPVPSRQTCGYPLSRASRLLTAQCRFFTKRRLTRYMHSAISRPVRRLTRHRTRPIPHFYERAYIGMPISRKGFPQACGVGAYTCTSPAPLDLFSFRPVNLLILSLN